MKLLTIAENAVTVQLDWQDCAALGRVCRELVASTWLDEAGLGAVQPFLGAFGAACEGAGMAAWAPGSMPDWGRRGYTLAGFRRSLGADLGAEPEGPPAEGAPPAA